MWNRAGVIAMTFPRKRLIQNERLQPMVMRTLVTIVFGGTLAQMQFS